MATSKQKMENQKGGMKTPPVVSPQEWQVARQQLLVKEKALTRSRDALAAERRRMPWMAVEKKYEFDGPKGKVRLLDLFEGRRQLIVYRAFFEPGVFGWPEHACRGCSLGADQVAHLAHLNARDTTLAYASRAQQADIARLKARMGWEMPWYTITDSFDVDFGVDQWHGHNAFIRDSERVFRTYFINGRGDEAMATTWPPSSSRAFPHRSCASVPPNLRNQSYGVPIRGSALRASYPDSRCGKREKMRSGRVVGKQEVIRFLPVCPSMGGKLQMSFRRASHYCSPPFA